MINDSNTPLHLLKPDYDFPYEIPTKEKITFGLKKILIYLEQASPIGLINKKNNSHINNKDEINEDTKFAEGNFRLTSYEWGVVYAGMLLAGQVTGEEKFIQYSYHRLKMIRDLSHFYLENDISTCHEKSSVYSVLNPQALDDCGSLCASMIKSEVAGLQINLRPLVNNFIKYISAKQYRFSDGTLARNRPYKNTLWLDDLFMSIPALAQIAALTKKNKYFDDAVIQLELFSKRMFNNEIGLYTHGWVEQMQIHPEYFWGRANGWAVMAMVELLSVLPESHSGYSLVLKQFVKHVKGLSKYQSGSGFWHQLIDRNDSYSETSATAIITYSITRAINLGIIDKYVFAPIAVLGWNAVSSKINNIGQVEGTCVGTGMGFDKAFYYHRPTNVFAAHGYGPILLAGAEIINMMENNSFEIIEGSIQVRD